RDEHLDPRRGRRADELLHRVGGLHGVLVREDRDPARGRAASGGGHGSTFRAAASTSSTAPGRPASAAWTNVSRFPAGPGSPEEANPITAAPCSRRCSATATSAARRSAGSRTTPPLPTR